ncbi:MAG: hypothetical protein WA821_20830 [Anaerolineales bacterium]
MPLLFYQTMMFTCVSLPKKIVSENFNLDKPEPKSKTQSRQDAKSQSFFIKPWQISSMAYFALSLRFPKKNLCDFATLRLRVKVF